MLLLSVTDRVIRDCYNAECMVSWSDTTSWPLALTLCLNSLLVSLVSWSLDVPLSCQQSLSLGFAFLCRKIIVKVEKKTFLQKDNCNVGG